MEKLKDVDCPASLRPTIEEGLSRERLRTLWEDADRFRTKILHGGKALKVGLRAGLIRLVHLTLN